jgi:DNA polymerase
MNNKQYRMLQLLRSQINSCELCPLHNNGRCNPYFTDKSQYVIIGEAPGSNEVEQNMPFVGTAGKHLWNIMSEYGFSREDFLIINTVNCRPINGNKNGKPTIDEMKLCKPWIRKHIKVMSPKAILSLGNYALYHTINEMSGITSYNGTVVKYGDIPTVLSVHPSMCIYNGEKGKEMLRDSISKLKEITL